MSFGNELLTASSLAFPSDLLKEVQSRASDEDARREDGRVFRARD